MRIYPASRCAFRSSLLLSWLSLALATTAGRAGSWPAWRGPKGDGHTDEKGLPLTWGGKKNEKVLWKVTIPGRSFSSPIVWGERVFITDAGRLTDAQSKAKVIPEHTVVCYRATDGKQLWRTVVPTGKFWEGYFSIPTPVTDGQRVYAWFGSGVAVALDLNGNILWRREHAGPYSVYPGVSSSPVLHGDTLLILCDQSNKSFLWALDRKTGAVKWEEKRKVAGSTNSSPIVARVKGKDQLLVADSRVLQGLDPASGKVLWWCGKDGGYWTSLTFGSGLVYTDSGGGRGLAVDPTGMGDVNKTKVKWAQPKVPEGLGCPLIVGDYIYRAHRPGMLRCTKLADGSIVYDKRLDGLSFLSSPIATADGRIYIASPRRSYVLKVGPESKVLAVNNLPGGDDGPSAAVAGGRLFLKSANVLFCIGTK